MKTIQHGRYLYQLRRFYMVNCYFVLEEDGLTLIDSSFSGAAGGIVNAAQKLGRSIRRITLTHAHGDHSGSLDALHAALPDAEVLLGARTAEFLSGNLALHPDEPQKPLRGSYITATTTADRLLASGDRIGSLLVVAAPGHAPDQIAFYDERDGTLIAGDAFQTLGGFAVAGIKRPLFPLPALATWDLGMAVASARRLAELQPARLAVGHGAVLENPDPAIAAGILEAEGSLDALAHA